MNWSSEQKKAIELEGNLLVSAAAGAGKTAVMTERIARRIAAGTGVDELLVVTFTRAAASEMKQRIEKRLGELADETDDTALRMALNEAAANVSSANISTIHSFCKNVLRRNYHHVGLDPAFRVGGDDETAILKNTALDETVEEFYLENEGEKTPAGDFLIRAFHKNKGISAIISAIYNFVIARPEPIKRLSQMAEAYNEGFDDISPEAIGYLISVSKREAEILSDQADALCRSGEADAYVSVLNSDKDMLFGLSQLLTYDSWYAAARQFKPEKLPSVRGGAPDCVKNYRDELKKLKSKLEERFPLPLADERKTAKALYPVVKKLAELTANFIEKYTNLKQQEVIIDFSAMEQLTLTALMDDEIAGEYRKRFKYVFVDEYQDTNLVQDSIIQRVSRGDNLFMVGDVKQSIYRFRQAEPAGFTSKYKSYDGTFGTRIDLNQNFRSTTSVLNAANTLFSKLMLGEVGEIDYSDNAELRAGEKQTAGSVELMLIELDESEYASVKERPEMNRADGASGEGVSDDENGAADALSKPDEKENALEQMENVEAEAAFIADKILELKGSLTVFDKEKNEYRPAEFSDFAVLMRRTSGPALRLVNTLSERGIPCTAELGSGYFDALEVQIFINLLRIIDNIRQDIPLVSVMRSSIGGFSLEELVDIKRMIQDRKRPFIECFEKAANFVTEEPDKEREGCEEGAADSAVSAADVYKSESEVPAFRRKTKAFYDKILEYRRLSRLMGVEELIGRLLEDTRFYIYTGALRGGEVRRANLDLLLEKAANFEQTGRRGLHSFINMLDCVRDNTDMGAAQEKAADAVSVMSIHKSKGLEFPVVFLCGLTGAFSTRDKRSSVILDGELGLALSVSKGFDLFSEMDGIDLSKTKKLLFRRAIEAKDSSKQISEEMRVLYVGMTRARERLLLVGAKKKMASFVKKKAVGLTDRSIMNAGCYMDWLLGAYYPLGLDLNAAIAGVYTPIAGDKLETRFSMSLVSENEDVRLKKRAFDAWRERAVKTPHEGADAALKFDYPYKEDTVTPARNTVTEYTDAEYEYVPATPSFALDEDKKQSAASRGTAVHRFIMLLPLRELTEDEIRSELEKQTSSGVLTRDEAAGIDIKSIIRLLDSALYRRMLASGAARREQEFSHLTEKGALMQGIVDCFFIENGGIVIIDYKTTSVKESSAQEVASRYAPQLGMYADALNRLTGLPVREKWVYLLSAGTAVKL